jgi:hypothetical protein
MPIRNTVRFFYNYLSGGSEPPTVCIETSVYYGLVIYTIISTLLLSMTGVRFIKKKRGSNRPQDTATGQPIRADQQGGLNVLVSKPFYLYVG